MAVISIQEKDMHLNDLIISLPNSKLDRKTLPATNLGNIELEQSFILPQTPVEKISVDFFRSPTMHELSLHVPDQSTMQEALEFAAIQSLSHSILILPKRPYRSSHHTTSSVTLVGGGSNPRPGEISLVMHGVLFYKGTENNHQG